MLDREGKPERAVDSTRREGGEKRVEWVRGGKQARERARKHRCGAYTL